jgi:carboxyl-terminal processing protease
MMKKKYLWILLPVTVAGLLAAGQVRDKFFEITKSIEIYTNVYKELNAQYVEELDPGQLMRTGVDAMMESLDPYTKYISESQIEDYRLFAEEKYNGLGAKINVVGDAVILNEVYEGFPAQKAGLRVGDQLLSINGRGLKAEDESVANRMLRGTPGSSALIEYKRFGMEEVQRVELVREEIDMPNVPFSRSLGNDIAYIKLSNFTPNASNNIARAYKKIKEDQGGQMKGIVLDLRDNPGGLLHEAVAITNLFVPKNEVVVSTRGKLREQDRVYRTLAAPLDAETPIVVLISPTSASASEIVSGALQDLDRGVVMGQLSYGKGLVQNHREVGYNSRIRVTVSKYYIPSGRCIQSVRYENGEPVPLPDSLRQPFKTKNGRTVLDGGGVLPDIELPKEDLHPLVDQLQKEGWIIRYVNEYTAGLDSLEAGLDYTFPDFDAFKKFLKKEDFSYRSPSGKWEDFLATVKEEGYSKSLSGQLSALESKLKEEQDAALVQLKPAIETHISRAIVKRFYFDTGLAAYKLDRDEEIIKAIELLGNQKAYNNILKPKAK